MEQKKQSILLVEDIDSLRDVLASVLESEGYEVTRTQSAEEALKAYKSQDFDLVLSDLKLPEMSGLDFLRSSKEIKKNIPFLVMTAYGNIDVAVDAMKCGASDFITKPFEPNELCSLIAQITTHQRIIDRGLGRNLKRKRRIITQSKAMEEVLHQARKVASLTSPVLLLGESGSGKELVARYIHEQSGREAHAFVPVNCGSMPSELLESEFFGHEAGSFTGATEQRLGLFEVADKGTIFLDEIGNMPWELQVKLLRTLQESEVKRLGSTQMRKVDARVISATNANLEDRIAQGAFREDLFYRLGVVVIEIPPLRERIEDIELIANFLVKTLSNEMKRKTPLLTRESIEYFESYSWPGNVRELENVIERALIFHEGPLTPECFELAIEPEIAPKKQFRPLLEVGSEAQRNAEIAAIREAMTSVSGNKTHAAKLLGVSYKTLLHKIREYSLEKASEVI